MYEITPIEIKDPASGQVVVRNGVILAFFLERYVHECSDALTEVFDRFVASTPPDCLKWAVVSATSEQWRDVDEGIMKRMRDSLAPVGARKRKFTAFRVNDFGDEAPQYSFMLSDRDKDEEQPVSRTLVQMTFPPSVIADNNLEKFCAMVAQFASLLKPTYGYCAPGLLASDAHQMAAFVEIRRIAKRYPGYDVAVNDLTQLDIGTRVRGARWITLLGPALIAHLGGLGAIRQAVPLEVDIRDLAGIAMIRAGTTPEIGDTNRRISTPLLRVVARLLEPITIFGEVNLRSYLANFDDDLLRQWERRFLD